MQVRDIVERDIEYKKFMTHVDSARMPLIAHGLKNIIAEATISNICVS